MFLPADHSEQESDFPGNSSFREHDWHILASFWHPVAFSHDISDKPQAAKLLDVNLVLYRTAQGISVARDRCPHRGVQVSAGRMIDDYLVCPMHGLHFDGDGICRKIPSLADQTAPISPKMCLRTYQSFEQYGIVWACLKDNPIWPLPQWRGIANPAYEKVYIPSDTWRASAARHVENFNDLAHFPWVHTQSFGSDASFSIMDYQVEDTDYGLRFEFPYEEGGNRFPDGVEAENRKVTYTYEFTFPFSTLLIVDPLGSDFVHYFADTACPISAHETRIFQLLTDSTGSPDPEFWINDSLAINADDKSLVESQPPQLPLGPGAELHHIPADRWSIRYRRLLAEKFGFGAG